MDALVTASDDAKRFEVLMPHRQREELHAKRAEAEAEREKARGFRRELDLSMREAYDALKKYREHEAKSVQLRDQLTQQLEVLGGLEMEVKEREAVLEGFEALAARLEKFTRGKPRKPVRSTS